MYFLVALVVINIIIFFTTEEGKKYALDQANNTLYKTFQLSRYLLAIVATVALGILAVGELMQ